MRPFFLYTLLLLAIVLHSSSVHSQSLTAEEKKVIDAVDKQLPEAIKFIETTVNTDSPTEDLAAVKAVGMMYAKEFEALGMSVKWIDMPGEMKRAGHLVAETKGAKGKRLLLLGHLDTVLKGEKYRVEGIKVFGTGVNDMKGGNAMIVYALKAIKAAGALKDTQIIVLLTGDEESTGKPESMSRATMRELAGRSDAALSFEAAVLNTATVGRRGWSSWQLEVSGKSGHSGQIFKSGQGYGAIFEASRILNEFREKLSKEKYLSFNPSLVVGGTNVDATETAGNASGKQNVIPAKVLITGDLRFISDEQKQSARKTMSEIVAKNLEGTTAKISFQDGNPAMSPNEGNYDLLRHLDKASRDLGQGEVIALDPGERGAGDISYVTDIIPGLDGIGIGGPSKSHAQGESAQIDTLAPFTKRVALLIYRLTR